MRLRHSGHRRVGHSYWMLYSTILAGGSGTRLWPLSRAGAPKFLHPLTGTDRSLLQATVDRIGPLSAAGDIYVVTGTAHAAAIARQLPQVPAANILVEPSPKDSCAAVSLASAVLAQRDPDAIMAAFSADHLVGDERLFAEIIKQAAAAARAGYLTTVGIRPAHPDVRFGYLKLGPDQLAGTGLPTAPGWSRSSRRSRRRRWRPVTWSPASTCGTPGYSCSQYGTSSASWPTAPAVVRWHYQDRGGMARPGSRRRAGRGLAGPGEDLGGLRRV